MTDAEIRLTLTELIRKELGLREPLPNGPLAEHLDSVQRLTLIVAIEDRFRICFAPEEEEAAETVDDVVRIIQAKTEDTATGSG